MSLLNSSHLILIRDVHETRVRIEKPFSSPSLSTKNFLFTFRKIKTKILHKNFVRIGFFRLVLGLSFVSIPGLANNEKSLPTP